MRSAIPEILVFGGFGVFEGIVGVLCFWFFAPKPNYNVLVRGGGQRLGVKM